MSLLALLAAAAISQGDSRATYTGNNGAFELSNFDLRGIEADFATGVTKFSGHGKSLRLRQLDRGLTLAAASMSGQLVKTGAQDVLDQFDAAGDAHLKIDSEQAAAYTKTPAKGPKSFTQLDTASFNYRRQGEDEVIQLPSLFSLAQTSAGAGATKDIRPVAFTFDQTTQMTGAKGRMVMAIPAGGGKTEIRTGVIEGPVKVTSERRETRAGESEVRRQTFNATCDRIELDFTGAERTIIATGHVHMTRVQADPGVPSHTQSFDGDRLVLIVDANLQPLKVRGEGAPTQTVLGGLGGGK